MSLLEEIKKLRELEQQTIKDRVEHWPIYQYRAAKLAPDMLRVLERWCTGYANTSRLHPKFHDGNNAAWKEDLEAYIKRINTVLNKKGILEKTGENHVK